MQVQVHLLLSLATHIMLAGAAAPQHAVGGGGGRSQAQTTGGVGRDV